MNMKIGTVAKQLGIHPATLRTLEKRGIISARRDYRGCRVFSPDELRQIEKVLFNGRMGNDQGDR